MSVRARERKTSVVQFIDTARKLLVHTMNSCRKFPKAMMFFITKDIVDRAREVYANVTKANAIFPKTKLDVELRYKYLVNAKGELEVLVRLLETLIRDFGEKGLGLGSEISQILALYYPDKIDRYIKEKLRVKYYGRYMDDGYLIHHDKDFLIKAKKGIIELAKTLDIVINEKKTHIIKISNGITWLKTRYYLTNTGKMIKKPNKKNIVRMRRKLKKFKKMIDNNEMSIEDVERSYVSWLGGIKKHNANRTLNEMNKLYDSLFKGCYDVA